MSHGTMNIDRISGNAGVYRDQTSVSVAVDKIIALNHVIFIEINRSI